MGLITSSCFEDENGNGIQFSAETTVARTFDQATEACLNLNLQPAQFTDETLANAANGFIEDVLAPLFVPDQFSTVGFWAGLERDAGLDPEDPNSFEYIDGTEVADFALRRLEFPWFEAAPGIGLQGDRSCVLALFLGSPPITRWFDFRCDDETRANSFAFCQASCELPTKQPTQNPTKLSTPIPEEQDQPEDPVDPDPSEEEEDAEDPEENEEENNEEESNAGAADIGIIIGSVMPVIALLVVFAFVAYLFVKKREKRKKAEKFILSSAQREERDKTIFERNEAILEFDSTTIHKNTL